MKNQFIFLFLLLFSTLSLAQSSLDSLRLVLPEGHIARHSNIKDNGISIVEYSPDGKLILIASEDDNFMLVYEALTGKLLHKLIGHKTPPSLVVFSQDSKKLFTSSDQDSSKYIWNVLSGNIEKKIIDESSRVISAEFSADGQWLLTNSQVSFFTSSSKVWNVCNKRKIEKIWIPGVNLCVKFKGDLSDVIAFDNYGQLNIWKLNNCQKNKSDSDWTVQLPTASTDRDMNMYSIYYNSESNKILFSDAPTRYFTVDLKTKLLTENFCESFLGENTHAFALFKTEDSIYTNVNVYRGTTVGKIILPAHGIKNILYHPNGNNIMLFNDDFTASYWNLSSTLCEWSSKDKMDEIIYFHWFDFSTFFNPIYNQFAELAYENEIQIWDMNQKKNSYTISSELIDVNSMKYLKKNRQVAFYSISGEVHLFNERNGQHVWGFKTMPSEFEGGSIHVDTNEQVLLTDDSDYQMYVYSIQTRQPLASFNTNLPEFMESGGKHSDLSPDGNFVLGYNTIWGSGLDRDSLENFSIYSVKRPNDVTFLRYNKPRKSPNDFSFSPDGRFCMAECSDTSTVILIWESKTGKLIRELRPGLIFGHPTFSAKGEYIACQTYNGEIKFYNFLTGDLIKVYKSLAYEIDENSFRLKDDTPWIAFINSTFNNSGGEILIYNYQNGDSITRILTRDAYNPKFEFGPKGGFLAFTSNKNSVSIFDLEKKEVRVNFINQEANPISFIFCNEDNGILINYSNNKSVYWDISSHLPIYERIQLANNNWLVKLPNSPYYMCSKDASKMLHYVTPSLKVIGFEQLDPVYNRPDIVLDSIGKYFGDSDGGMIDEYRKSWEKRIDRLGLDKEKLGKGEIAVPNAEIFGADDIAYENKEGTLEIKVSANDPKYPLSRFNVFVNEVPLYGSTGISIAHLKKQVWDTTVSVPLSVGENKIQVSVMNELGLENFKYPTYVNYMSEKEIVAKTHYIGIGVNEFKESSHNLKYCVKDVRDLAREFASENKNVDTLLFTDKQVTKENILALKDYLNKTSVNDKVIISCSSHGLLDDSLNFYLAMHDVDFNNPEVRGLKYEELESLLDGIPARQKLLLLDACNSGEIEKQLEKETKDDEYLIEKDTSGNKIGRGLVQPKKIKKQTEFQKMNELFVNVRNNTGSVIISAAGGQESALEAIKVDDRTIENGAFTYSILECLKQNEGKELKVNTLKQYAEKRVEEITNGKQKPTSRQETMEVDWGVR